MELQGDDMLGIYLPKMFTDGYVNAVDIKNSSGLRVGYNLLYIALPYITNSRVHTFNVSIIQVKDIGYSMLFVTGDAVCINTEDSIK